MINMNRDWISLLLVFVPTIFAAVNAGAADAVVHSGTKKVDYVFDGVQNMDKFQEEMLLEHDASERQLLYQCDGPTETYYFEVFIRITPDPVGSGVCSLADQVLMGNDFNQLLLLYGIGDAGVEDDVFYLAGVCPQPVTTNRRKLLIATSGFVFSGGGGCRYCLPDDYDRRKKNLRNLSGWFDSNFAPQTSKTLEDAILTTLAPDHTSCLGLNPVVDVELVQVGLHELDLSCEEDGTTIESLKSVSIADAPMIRHNCHKCVSLDFSQFGDGAAIDKGTWIGDQFKQDHGLTITASGGYSHSSNARIFDTGDAECVNVDGSRDFGSPNKNCGGVSGGLGEGVGGEIGESGENCVPIGNVLIVQESDKECPDSNAQGGSITFTWDSPVLISDIGLMDVDEDEQRIKFKYSDDFVETFSYSGFGDNAVQRIIASKLNVVQVEIIFPGTGAVTEINFCPECLPFVDHDSDHHCLYTDDKTKIQAQEVISFEDFDTANTQSLYWECATGVGYSDYLTKYIFQQEGDGDIGRFFTNLDPDAIGFILEFDFYEIDRWTKRNFFTVSFGSNRFDLGKFTMRRDEGHREGANALGVAWTVDSLDVPGHYGGNPKYLDQRHRVKFMLPASTLYYSSNTNTHWFFLSFDTMTDSADSVAGYDNIKVTAIHGCHAKES